MIDLTVVDSATKDLLSRTEQEGGLSDKVFEIIASIGQRCSILNKFTKIQMHGRNDMFCDKTQAYKIYDTNVIVCLKNKKCTVIQITKA